MALGPECLRVYIYKSTYRLLAASLGETKPIIKPMAEPYQTAQAVLFAGRLMVPSEWQTAGGEDGDILHHWPVLASAHGMQTRWMLISDNLALRWTDHLHGGQSRQEGDRREQ